MRRARAARSATYNFTGDLGKAAIPALTALLLIGVPWRASLGVLGAVGLAIAVAIALLMPPIAARRAAEVARRRRPAEPRGGGRGGFPAPLRDRRARQRRAHGLPHVPAVPAAREGRVAADGRPGAGAGVHRRRGRQVRLRLARRTLRHAADRAADRGRHRACIFAVLALPLAAALALLPLLGIMLNGTSSVLYGTVPELVPPERAERAFALFYTGTIGSGALAPVLFGFFGDAVGVDWATAATAVTALATFPLAIALAPRLRAQVG